MSGGAIIDTQLGSYDLWLVIGRWRLGFEYKRFTRMGRGPQLRWSKL